MREVGAGLRYDPETDFWCDDASASVYLECDIASGRSSMLNVTGARWEGRVNAWRCFIDWDPEVLNLPPGMVTQAREATLILLKRRSPSWLNGLRLALTRLHDLLPEHVERWNDLSMADWHVILTNCKPKEYLYHLRTLFHQIAIMEKSVDMLQRHNQLLSYKIGKKNHLEDVTSWNPKTGAYVDEELENLMQFLRKPGQDTAAYQAYRIVALLYLRFGKRPLQLTSIQADGLTSVTHQGVTQYYLRIPKVKGQRGRSAELWEIPADLALEIQRFSDRPEIQQLQQETDTLLVWDTPAFRRDGVRVTSSLSTFLTNFMKEAGLTTQRDKNLPPEPLVFNARRARHTVGTQLAFDGAPSEYISRILEHDSPSSAKAYIDAVASLVHDAINRADHALGGIFSGLAETYFSGNLVSELTDRPIFIPDFSQGLIPVGSCGLDIVIHGECRKYPFLSCFGCVSFLAWQGGDFARARAYVQSLLQHWLDAAGQPARSQVVLEFERIYQAILYVETRIKQAEG